MMHWLSRQFLVDSQALSKRAWDNALLPIWLKLEETYQSKEEKEEIEDHSIKIIKGKESSKNLECIISKCDFENISSEDK
jgi:hypothetical protein